MGNRTNPLFHHCTSLETLLKTECLFGHPDWVEVEYRKSYAVWERLFGFHPLFLAMGRGPETIVMTGYPNQFGRVVSCRYDQEKKKRVNTLRPKGEAQNLVLLSFEHCDGVAHKFDTWEDVFCLSFNSGKCPKLYTDRLVRQGRRCLASWINSAKRKDGYVQLCAASLEPKAACRVWVRNQDTKKALEEQGYQNVEVRRFPATQWWR